MRRRLVILILAALAPGSVAAQTRPAEQPAPLASRFIDANGLTLDQAIERALEHEPSLRVARAEIDVARGMRVQAALKPNPTVSFAQQAEPGGTDTQTRIEAQWPMDLFRKTGRINVAEREVEATQKATADRERRLISDLLRKFGEVLTAVRELSVTDDLVAVTARQNALMTARADEGTIPPLERDIVRVELQRLEADRMLQVGHAEHALIELKRLLGLSADAPLTLREDLEQLVAAQTATSALRQGPLTGTRPDVDEAEARVNAADAQIDRARRDGRFDVSLFGMYMRNDSGFPQRGFGDANDIERVRGVFHYVAGGVMVSLPLRDRKQGEVAVAEAQRAGAQAELEARRLTAQAEIAAARTRDDHARQALGIYTAETRALAKRNLDVVSQTYDAGRMTLFDVLNERRRYLETERAYTSALGEAFEARQALRTALGEVR
jgi:outer membrane protein, heavy metal efflux system